MKMMTNVLCSNNPPQPGHLNWKKCTEEMRGKPCTTSEEEELLSKEVRSPHKLRPEPPLTLLLDI